MQKKLKSRNEELVHFSGEIGRIYIYTCRDRREGKGLSSDDTNSSM